MSQATRQLVSKIQNLASKPQAHWTTIHQSLAKEYTSLVASLADRATVVEFQFDLNETAQAKIALKHPTDLLEELRLLHFPMRSVWERMLQNRGISPRPLPAPGPLLVIAQKLAAGTQSDSGTKKRPGPPPPPGGFASPNRDHSPEADFPPLPQRIRDEAGFAPKGSPTLVRMLPLALVIGVVSLALLALALLGPAFMKDKDDGVAGGKAANQEPLDPKALLVPREEKPGGAKAPPAEAKAENQDAHPVLRKANAPLVPEPKDTKDKNPKDNQPIKPDLTKKMAPKENDGDKPNPEEKKAREIPAGSIQMPEIAKLGTLLDQNGPKGSAVKAMLEIDGDIAPQKSLDRFLAFVRADTGLVGRKTLTLPEFLEMANWQKPLSREQAALFDPERLDRCSKMNPRSEEELASWIATATLTPNAFVLVDPKRKSIQLEALLGLAGSEQILADLLEAINKRVITEKDPKNGTPTKITVRYQVMLQQKRELKDRTNQDLAQDVTVVHGELVRRLKALGHPGIK